MFFFFFKQKTAYEMLRSLVGSEMCIRDSALIHHMAISNNVPLGMLAEFFAGLGRWLIIEFVPKGDHKVQKLLATREDIFPDYTSEGFERAFSGLFTIRRKDTIRESTRELYLLERK